MPVQYHSGYRQLAINLERGRSDGDRWHEARALSPAAAAASGSPSRASLPEPARSRVLGRDQAKLDATGFAHIVADVTDPALEIGGDVRHRRQQCRHRAHRAVPQAERCRLVRHVAHQCDGRGPCDACRAALHARIATGAGSSMSRARHRSRVTPMCRPMSRASMRCSASPARWRRSWSRPASPSMRSAPAIPTPTSCATPSTISSPKTRRSEDEARAGFLNPQGRLIQPEEVAAVVAYLVSDDARSVTGQALAIAGGEL